MLSSSLNKMISGMYISYILNNMHIMFEPSCMYQKATTELKMEHNKFTSMHHHYEYN